MYKIYTKNGVLEKYAHKILLVMRLTTIILLVTIMQVSAASFAQNITLNRTNASLESVLKDMRKQSGYDFLFDRNLLKNTTPVNLKVTNISLEEALKLCLRGQSLSYLIDNRSVIITEKEKTLLSKVKDLLALPIDFRGKVVDELENPLPGATIKVVKSNKTATTNANGEFIIAGVDDASMVTVTFVGYQPRTLKVTSEFSKITLLTTVSQLREVIINKGYYQTIEKLNTGSVSKVTSEEISRQPLTNPIQTLEGLVPGMFIQQTSGMAGSATNVIIRGRNSLNPTSITRPLYVIDGITFNGGSIDQQVGAGQTTIGAQPNGSTDPLNMISPNDIESITVLKDADATSLYGSRGANGVVLITTKTGVKGKSVLNLNVYRGAGKITNTLPIISNEQYRAIRTQAFANDNRTITAAIAPDLLVWDQNTNTDYQKELIGNTSDVTEATASLSGGNETTTFLLSGTFHDEGAVMKGDFFYRRGSVNMKLNHKSADGKLKLDFNTNYAGADNRMPASDFTVTSLQYPGNYPTYNPDGSFYWFSTIDNPEAMLLRYYKTESNNLLLSSNIGYSILPGLNVKVRIGHNISKQDQRQIYPGSSSNPAFNNPSSGLYSSNNSKTYIAEPQIDYSAHVWGGSLNTTIGGTWQHTKANMPYFLSASNFPSETLLDNFSTAGTISAVRTMSSEYKYISAFGILNYNIANKYVLNATYRRDGSSRFGDNRKFGNFGSVGAAWILSEEPFIKNLKLFSFAKIRGSYGVTGNDQTDNYTYLDTYTATTAYGSFSGFRPTRVANPEYQWETNNKAELAAELGFLKDRLNINAAYYRHISENMIATSPLAAQTGFSSFITNLDGKVQNAGVEIELRGTPVKTANITWNAGFNISTPRNKLLQYPTGLAASYSNYVEGMPLNLIRVYKFSGFEDGIAQFADLNNDGAITGGLTNDQYAYGTTDPKYYGGFNSNFSYKNFRVDILLNFVKQLGYAVTSFPGLIRSVTADVADSPFKPSSLSSSASYVSYNSYYINSDARVTDASYLRMRNLSVSYNLPPKLAHALKTRNISLYLRGQNLFTITSYKGLDPETQGTTLPPIKMFTAGLQCSF